MLLSREAPDRTTSELPDCRRRAICGKPFSFSPINWLIPLDIYERRPREELACGLWAPWLGERQITPSKENLSIFSFILKLGRDRIAPTSDYGTARIHLPLAGPCA